VPRFRTAYAALTEDIRKVPTAELATINIDIPTAVTTALAAVITARLAALPRWDRCRLAAALRVPRESIRRF